MKRKRAQVQQKPQYDPRFPSNVINIDQRLNEKRKRVQIYPKNLSQETYLLKLNDPNKMIVFDKIIITRPAVSVDEQHGFLPGDLNEKMEPWTKPIFDVFTENFNAREIENFVKEGVIETSPLAYMRGRTFKNAVIVADEMQNATPSQMKMLLTRLGQGSKMVVTGDLQQADRPSTNGLLEFLHLYNNFQGHRYVDLVEFNIEDVERHEAVKEILSIYGDT